MQIVSLLCRRACGRALDHGLRVSHDVMRHSVCTKFQRRPCAGRRRPFTASLEREVASTCAGGEQYEQALNYSPHDQATASLPPRFGWPHAKTVFYAPTTPLCAYVNYYKKSPQTISIKSEFEHQDNLDTPRSFSCSILNESRFRQKSLTRALFFDGYCKKKQCAGFARLA